jgi:hypothetical protein
MPAFQLFPRSTCDARPVTIDGGLEVDDAEEPALIFSEHSRQGRARLPLVLGATDATLLLR